MHSTNSHYMLSDSHKYFSLPFIFVLSYFDHLCILWLKDILPGIIFCMHVIIYRYICLHIHTYIYAVLPMSIHPSIHAYIHIYIHTCLPTSINPYIHTYVTGISMFPIMIEFQNFGGETLHYSIMMMSLQYIVNDFISLSWDYK